MWYTIFPSIDLNDVLNLSLDTDNILLVVITNLKYNSTINFYILIS